MNAKAERTFRALAIELKGLPNDAIRRIHAIIADERDGYPFDFKAEVDSVRISVKGGPVYVQAPIIYKVRMFVNDTPTRGKNKGIIERIEYREEVIINNLEFARAKFADYKNAVQAYDFNSRYQGKAELFIPHVHESGVLADWPDNDQYIERYEMPEN